MMDWKDFKEARQKLGLSINQLAEIIDTNPVTIRKWETAPDKNTARAPNPIACRVLEWMGQAGRPGEWPTPPSDSGDHS